MINDHEWKENLTLVIFSTVNFVRSAKRRHAEGSRDVQEFATVPHGIQYSLSG